MEMSRCFEIQDTWAWLHWCTLTPVLARSAVTSSDKSAQICVFIACVPRA